MSRAARSKEGHTKMCIAVGQAKSQDSQHAGNVTHDHQWLQCHTRHDFIVSAATSVLLVCQILAGDFSITAAYIFGMAKL